MVPEKAQYRLCDICCLLLVTEVSEGGYMIYTSARALELLRIGSGYSDALFRESQEEAIRSVIEGGGRLLVVQKTGWGKSFVYFIATKLLREGGSGPVLLISPLLALMRNQIEAAERMGVRASTINSDNPDDWFDVEARIGRNAIDTHSGTKTVWCGARADTTVVDQTDDG